jgi:hypothetical protein
MTTDPAASLPAPRPGLLGEWDKFIGPGATRAEVALILGAAVFAALASPLYALSHGLTWTLGQHLVALLLAADLAGGVVANAAAPAKRWYHRPGHGHRQRLLFVSVHAIYIFLVAWLFHNLDWAYFAGYTAYLLGAAWLVERAPRSLRRPGAYALTMGAVLLNSLGLPPAPGLGWFVPLLFIKLLLGHLLPD